MIGNYVYIYRDEEGTPRYVGAGSGDRWRTSLRQNSNSNLQAMIQRMNRLETPIICEIVAEYESPADAMAHEKRLIASYGRVSTNDGTLYNVYPGTDAGNVGRNAKITEHALRFSNLQLVRRCAPLNTDQDMPTDPKVTRLATAITEAIAALVDLAKDGEAPVILHSAEAVEERPTPTADAPAAKAKRQAKSASAGDALSNSAEEASSTTVAETKARAEPEAEIAEEDAKPPTLDDARKLAVDLAKAKGRAGLLDVLTSFAAAAGVSALAEDQIADFCDAVRESLAA